MKPETGNKPIQAQNKVSIQLSLDGHSFSPSPLPERAGGEDGVWVELISPRTMLVPESLFAPQTGRELLAANGTPATADERIVCSEVREGAVAVMPVAGEVLQQIEAKYPANIRFTSPLLHRPAESGKCVWMARWGKVLYIKIYREGVLLLAEAIEAETDDDLRYFVERLNGTFPLAEFELRAAGEEAGKLRKRIGKIFARAICE